MMGWPASAAQTNKFPSHLYKNIKLMNCIQKNIKSAILAPHRNDRPLDFQSTMTRDWCTPSKTWFLALRCAWDPECRAWQRSLWYYCQTFPSYYHDVHQLQSLIIDLDGPYWSIVWQLLLFQMSAQNGQRSLWNYFATWSSYVLQLLVLLMKTDSDGPYKWIVLWQWSWFKLSAQNGGQAA